MALPEFQRDFVWDPGKVVELLESIANGWPIGSLLILEGPQPFEVKPIEGGPDVDADAVELYLLDGQQRATSLYHALTDTSDVIYYVDFGGETADPDLQFRWTRRDAGRPSPLALTVHELTDEDAYAVATEGLSSRERRDIRDRRVDVLGSLATSDYRIPATVMDEDIELEALTRIFETLNRTAVKLNAFDLMVAVLYSDDFNLRQEWKAARASFTELVDFEVDGLEILKLVALMDINSGGAESTTDRRSVTGVRQRDVLNLPARTVDRFWNHAVSSYRESLTLLRDDFGVPDANSMPSDAMVLTMSCLLHKGTAQSAVRSWYWAAIASQSYSQGANTRVLQDVRRMTASPATALEHFRQEANARLTPALKDSSRRNRILRLGLRGLYRKIGAAQVFGSEGATGSVSELSLAEFAAGRIKAGSDAPILDLMWFTKSDANILRKAAQTRNPMEQLMPAVDALWRQDLDMTVDTSERRAHRLKSINSRLTEAGRIA